MDLWVSFWSALASLIPDNGLMMVAAIVLLRSAAVPIPVPADLLVVMVGVEAAETGASLWPAWLLLSVATTIGAALLYTFSRWVGRVHGDILHYGRYVGLTQARISTAEAQLDARGARAVVLGRIIPGLRAAIVAVCGMLRFRWSTFLFAVFFGALIYVGACLVLGYVFGPSIVEFLGNLVFPLGLIEPLLGLTILLVWLVRARRAMPAADSHDTSPRSRGVRAGAFAGALAIAGASMLINLLIYLGGPIAVVLMHGTGELAAYVATSGGLTSLLLALVISVLAGTLWGSAYASLAAEWSVDWPDWLRGLTFGALPFAVALILELITLPSGVWPVEALAEAIRWGTYGVLVGLMYPVFRARAVVRVAAANERGPMLAESPVE